MIIVISELLPDQNEEVEAQDDIPTEIVISGLPFLSQNLKISSGVGRESPLERDLALYDKKAREYLEQLVCEARASGRSELNVPDPLRCWLTQVYHGCR